MKIRISVVQYELKPISGVGQFKDQVIYNLEVAKDMGAQVVVFPEFLTTQLMSFFLPTTCKEAIRNLSEFTREYLDFFTRSAANYQLHILGGTHITCNGENIYNTAHFFFPDGRVYTQDKVHLTPTERQDWRVTPGNRFEVFSFLGTTAAILTCYDIEFPEAARLAAQQGAKIIFCPSCTDDRTGFHRVRYCCHARTIENQLYVVTTGTVGQLPGVRFMESNFGQGALLCPNDIPFARDGIIVQGEINQPMVVTGDLDMELLEQSRISGSVSPWRDRRLDLYGEIKSREL